MQSFQFNKISTLFLQSLVAAASDINLTLHIRLLRNCFHFMAGILIVFSLIARSTLAMLTLWVPENLSPGLHKILPVKRNNCPQLMRYKLFSQILILCWKIIINIPKDKSISPRYPKYNEIHFFITLVKLLHYRPGRVLWAPRGWGSQNFYKIGTPLIIISVRGWVRSRWKIPMTPTGIKPATFSLWRRASTNCATVYPLLTLLLKYVANKINCIIM